MISDITSKKNQIVNARKDLLKSHWSRWPPHSSFSLYSVYPLTPLIYLTVVLQPNPELPTNSTRTVTTSSSQGALQKKGTEAAQPPSTGARASVSGSCGIPLQPSPPLELPPGLPRIPAMLARSNFSRCCSASSAVQVIRAYCRHRMCLTAHLLYQLEQYAPTVHTGGLWIETTLGNNNIKNQIYTIFQSGYLKN